MIITIVRVVEEVVFFFYDSIQNLTLTFIKIVTIVLFTLGRAQFRGNFLPGAEK